MEEESEAALYWYNISFFVHRDKRARRTILENVSGSAKRGQITAIMGPTSCGKTTLLNAIGSRFPKTAGGSLRGRVVFFSHAQNEEGGGVGGIPTRVAYVKQEDALFPYLTVRETIALSAYFYLPQDTLLDERERHVSDVLAQLSLSKCQDTLIGSVAQRGVSGGERKRISIGRELVASPSVILLDEPTSGLDSFQALSLITALKKLALAGRVVLLAIHQPRSSIFAHFDKLYLLTEGKLVYEGAASSLASYLSSFGFDAPLGHNVADYVLDVISLDTRTPALEHDSRQRIDFFFKLEQEQQLRLSGEGRGDTRDRIIWTLDDAGDGGVIESSSSATEEEEGDDDDEHGEQEEEGKKEEVLGEVELKKKRRKQKRALLLFPPGHASSKINPILSQRSLFACASWWSDVCVLFSRATIMIWRNIFGLVLKFTNPLVQYVLLALIYRNLGHSQTNIQDRLGLLFFVSMYQSLGPFISVLNTFSDEKIVTFPEIKAKAYSSSAYFVARVLSELPVPVISAIAYSTIVYWVAKLNPNPFRFLIFVALVVLETCVAVGTGFVVSAGAKNSSIAIAIGPPIVVIFFLFGGYFINVHSLPPGAAWVTYLSPVYWTWSGLVLNEFKGETFACPVAANNPNPVNCVYAGELVIKHLGFEKLTVKICAIALALVFVGVCLLAYLFLALSVTQSEMPMREPKVVAIAPSSTRGREGGVTGSINVFNLSDPESGGEDNSDAQY